MDCGWLIRLCGAIVIAGVGFDSFLLCLIALHVSRFSVDTVESRIARR